MRFSSTQGSAQVKLPKVLCRALAKWRIIVTIFLLVMVASYVLEFKRVGALARGMTELPITANQRILVISPHPDDESLGAAGLIQKALAKGSDVMVVFMTNGDGFDRGARAGRFVIRVKPESFIEYGIKRKREAVDALNTLGVSKEKIMFLGYPDGGLASIWRYHWDVSAPLTSRTTRCSLSPYTGGEEELSSPYTSPSILSSLSKIILSYQPTDILVPHPHDTHPDHWATSAFVSTALTQLRYRELSEANLYTYIIHRGQWQTIPLLSKEKPMLPPKDMRGSDTIWHRVTLSQSSMKTKAKALNLHASQVKLMREFLDNFVRPNEIFGSLVPKEIAISADGLLHWDHLLPIVEDPQSDTFISYGTSAGDLKCLYLVQGEDALTLRFETWGSVSTLAKYKVSLYVLPFAVECAAERFIFKVDPKAESLFRWVEYPDYLGELPLTGYVKTNSVTVSLPIDLRLLGHSVMAGVESRFGAFLLDMTPWWVIGLNTH